MGAMFANMSNEQLDYKQYPMEWKKTRGVERSCRNVPALLFFIVALIYLARICFVAFETGDPARFAGLPDSAGHVCGMGLAERTPYLYFCQDQFGTLASNNRICVEHCPGPDQYLNSQSARFDTASDSLSGQHHCPQGDAKDYDTSLYAGKLCMPRDSMLTQQIETVYLGRRDVKFFMFFSSVWDAWTPIMIAASFSILCGFGFLWIVKRIPQVVMWAGFIVIIGACFFLGVDFIRVSRNSGYDHIAGTGDSRYDLCVGVACLFIGCCTIVMAFIGNKSMVLASACIQAAGECIWDVPSLLFEPAVGLFIRVPIMTFFVYGSAYLISSVDTQADANEFVQVGHIEDNYHLKVQILYSKRAYANFAFYIFMFLWIMEIVSAFSHFVVAYATEMWFFCRGEPGHTGKKDTPPFLTCSAYGDGLRYHLGTFVFGSFIILVLRPVRIVTRCFVEAMSSLPSGSGVCSQRCAICYDENLRYITRTAWFDVAINGNPFCRAAYHATRVFQKFEAQHIHNAAGVMHGASWVVQFAGLWGIATAAAGTTLLFCMDSSRYGRRGSPYFVEDPIMVSVVSFITSAFVVMPFMLLFQDVADSVLFCFALENERERSKPAIIQAVDSTFKCCSSRENQSLTAMETKLDHPQAISTMLKMSSKVGTLGGMGY